MQGQDWEEHAYISSFPKKKKKSLDTKSSFPRPNLLPYIPDRPECGDGPQNCVSCVFLCIHTADEPSSSHSKVCLWLSELTVLQFSCFGALSKYMGHLNTRITTGKGYWQHKYSGQRDDSPFWARAFITLLRTAHIETTNCWLLEFSIYCIRLWLTVRSKSKAEITIVLCYFLYHFFSYQFFRLEILLSYSSLLTHKCTSCLVVTVSVCVLPFYFLCHDSSLHSQFYCCPVFLHSPWFISTCATNLKGNLPLLALGISRVGFLHQAVLQLSAVSLQRWRVL